MKLHRILVAATLSLIALKASANPIAQLTFDMSFRGFTMINGQFNGYFTDPAKPILDTIVVTLPFMVRNVQTYNDSYASNYVLNFGSAEPSAGLKISSGKMDAIIAGPEYRAMVDKDLKDIGIIGTAPSSTTPSPRDYAFLAKRDVHNVSDAQRFYTFIDASTQVTQKAIGIDNADFLQMVRINGGIFGQPGDLDPFSLSDVPAMLLNIDNQQSPGFVINYTSFVDTRPPTDGSLTGRPFEVLYQGTGKLTGFTIDGVNQIPSPVPESETYAMLLAGLSILRLMALRRRG
jgi:hypothetical protein